jgi:predicted transglutaminase-like protease
VARSTERNKKKYHAGITESVMSANQIKVSQKLETSGISQTGLNLNNVSKMQLNKNRNLQFKKERKTWRVSMEAQALLKVLP